MNWKKMTIGIVVAISIWLVGDEILTRLDASAFPTIQFMALTALGSGVGAYIAQRNFMLPAMIAWLAWRSLIIYATYQVAAPVGQASLSTILGNSSTSLAISALALVLGVLAGRNLAGHKSRLVAAT